MNLDDFENRIKHQPWRPPPAGWRREILEAARSSVAADDNRRTLPIRELTFAATLQQHLREWFWPHPVAWGALATLWLALGTIHLVMREPGLPAAEPLHVDRTAGVPTLMAMQRELLSSLDEPVAKPKAARIQPPPPQSGIRQCRETLET